MRQGEREGGRLRPERGRLTARQVRILLGSAALFALALGLRFAVAAPSDAVSLLFVVPVAALGVEFGRRGGLVAAGVAAVLVVVWSYASGADLSWIGYATRLVAFALVGGLVGQLGEEREASQAEAQRWFEMSNDLLAIVRDGYFMRLNQAWVECLGYTLAELMSKPYAHFVHPGDIERTAEMSAALASGPGEVANFENRYRTKSGGWCWLLWSARSDGRQIYAAAKHISERKQAQLEREHQLSQAEAVARTDPLTGLPNRRAWEEALERELARAQSRGHPIALALLDLDYFKRFNDARGHQAGDELLREAAAAWRHILRATDFVARYGGDEFAVLLPDCSTPQTLSVLDRLVAATPERQTCSIGFAHWDRIESASDLIARADRALYEAKHSGRSRAIRATPSVTLTGGLLLAPEAGTTVR